MTEPTLVKITRYDPGPLGDTGEPFVGKAGLKPSLIRHIEGETPPDYVVTRRKFWVTFGAALKNGNVVIGQVTPGVAWVLLEPTNTGPYANAWAWEFDFTVDGGSPGGCEAGGLYYVPESAGTVDFGDLVPVDPNALPELPPEWQQQIVALIGTVADLQAQIDGLIAGSTRAVSTDGSFGLPAPSGVGQELVWAADALVDIRYDGVSG